MRWDNLFDDLESQLEHELSAEGVDLQAEEERLRLGRMSVRDRLAALHRAQGSQGDYSVLLLLAEGASITVHPVAFGKDWLSGDLLDESSLRRQCLVPLTALAGIVLKPGQVADSLSGAERTPGPRELSARLGLTFVLRDLCRRRQSVEFQVLTGTVHGTIDRVGRDHVDVAVHERGAPRRASAVLQHRLVPLSQVQLLRF